jgi:hypothetical protein
MPELINKRIMLELLSELTAVWPSRMDDEQQVRRAQVYRDALIGFDEAAVRHAVKRVIQEDSFFPKPARLRELAQAYVAYHRRADAGKVVESSRCTTCGEEFQYRVHWRPATSKTMPIRWLVTACGQYLLLERFERYLCGCAPQSHYVPEPALLGAEAVPIRGVRFHMPFVRTAVVVTAAAA